VPFSNFYLSHSLTHTSPFSLLLLPNSSYCCCCCCFVTFETLAVERCTIINRKTLLWYVGSSSIHTTRQHVGLSPCFPIPCSLPLFTTPRHVCLPACHPVDCLFAWLTNSWKSGRKICRTTARNCYRFLAFIKKKLNYKF